MNIKEMEHGRYHIVLVYDTLDFFNISEFKKVFLEDILVNHTHVALELIGNRNEISSSVISALVVGHKKQAAKKGSLVLLNVDESLKNILMLGGLSGFFTMIDSINDLSELMPN